ncbi:MAG: hypothetical protein JRF15_14885 [Deltaproteobacteria bacterium]|jgi:hypothetical protein|nr:hypothetical protein [Deltaproteobacteria bacterium]
MLDSHRSAFQVCSDAPRLISFEHATLIGVKGSLDRVAIVLSAWQGSKFEPATE